MKVVIFVFFIMLSGCSKRYPTAEKSIVIGNGGGLTGAVSKYKLTDSGRLYYSNDILDNYQFVGRMDKNLTSIFFDNYYTLNLQDIELDETGNRYFFIEMSDNEKMHKIIWTEDTEGSTEDLLLYYRVAMWKIKNYKNNLLK